jgi:uroporphyrin-3 C-methyltransferase
MAEEQSDENQAELAETAPEPEQSKEPEPVKRSGSNAGLWIAILTLVLLIGASALAAVMLLRGQDQQAQLNRDFTALTTSLQQMGEQLQDSERKLQETVQSVRQAEQRLQDSMQKLFAEAGRNKRDWALAETEYLIRLAQHRLQLSRDAETARQALTLAGGRLKEINDPSLVRLREMIASQIKTLDAVLAQDDSEPLVVISTLLEQVEQLPLLSLKKAADESVAASTPSTEETTSKWQHYLSEAWTVVSPMVKIRRQDEPVTPLLPPEQYYFLHQNLLLQLRSARLSALLHDNDGYARNIGQARQWVQAYYDSTTKPVADFLAALDQIARVNVNPPLPDLSEMLKLSNELRQPGKEAAAQ